MSVEIVSQVVLSLVIGVVGHVIHVLHSIHVLHVIPSSHVIIPSGHVVLATRHVNQIGTVDWGSTGIDDTRIDHPPAHVVTGSHSEAESRSGATGLTDAIDTGLTIGTGCRSGHATTLTDDTLISHTDLSGTTTTVTTITASTDIVVTLTDATQTGLTIGTLGSGCPNSAILSNDTLVVEADPTGSAVSCAGNATCWGDTIVAGADLATGTRIAGSTWTLTGFCCLITFKWACAVGITGTGGRLNASILAITGRSTVGGTIGTGIAKALRDTDVVGWGTNVTGGTDTGVVGATAGALDTAILFTEVPLGTLGLNTTGSTNDLPATTGEANNKINYNTQKNNTDNDTDNRTCT